QAGEVAVPELLDGFGVAELKRAEQARDGASVGHRCASVEKCRRRLDQSVMVFNFSNFHSAREGLRRDRPWTLRRGDYHPASARSPGAPGTLLAPRRRGQALCGVVAVGCGGSPEPGTARAVLPPGQPAREGELPESG